MAKTKETTSIEAQLKRLEEIANSLDRGELTIDEQLKIYEEGMQLANASREYLLSAELKIKELGGVSEDESVED
ncbi:MAG: exodeoxyribonuclease VII small subunit [Ignavibacteria bacterium]|nr:exodeoxyribonuclease VII small subunit [Ignavibacteria bacterium]